ncbi:MAG TPA: FtsK/SpoIIIE domain-containing protein [Rhizomicrobium sp.]
MGNGFATTTKALDTSAIEAEFERSNKLPDGYERLNALSKLAETNVAIAWREFIKFVDAKAKRIDHDKAALDTAIQQKLTNALQELETAYAAAIRTPKQQLADIISDLQGFAEASGSFVEQFWVSRSAMLGLGEPKQAMAAVADGIGEHPLDLANFKPGERPSDIYLRAKASADALPKIGGTPREVIMLCVGAISSLLVGLSFWGITQNTTIAWGLTIWAVGGTLLLPLLSYAQIADIYRHLLEATVREKTLRKRRAEAAITVLEGILNASRREYESKKAQLQENANAQLLQGSAKYVKLISETHEWYRAGRVVCAELISRIAGAIRATIAADPDLYGSNRELTAAGPQDAVTPAQRTRFRLGVRTAAALNGPTPEMIKLLALNSSDTAPIALSQPLPVFWCFSQKKSLIHLCDQPAGSDDSGFPTDILMRMLHQIPAGKINFTFFDPIGLGRNFAGFLALGDYSARLINGNVWSDREHMRQKLKDLITDIQTITQKYLRRDHEDIESYNAAVEEIEEPYRVLVIADFPEAFDEDIARDLLRVFQNGPRCGVFAIVHANTARPLAHGVSLDQLRPFALELTRSTNFNNYAISEGIDGSSSDAAAMPKIDFTLDITPDDETIKRAVVRFGVGAEDALKVEVPYARLFAGKGAAENKIWAGTSKDGLEVPLGPKGAKGFQSLRLGKGLAHHALIVGRPGSGKSNLLHVFITAASRLYSPAEVQFYLIDFKQGVEFKCYADAKLPHARVIAIESEREFGLSVLEGLAAELNARGELFKATAGCQNIADYRNKTGNLMPRIVLVVDEFQEFFTREDRIKREVTVLLDRLVRQGRAFGIHIFLGTQSLANSGLERSTQDQMAVRIALQCSEADSRLILAQDNVDARLLSRPGEAIYNDQVGLIEANNRFQVALFSESDRLRELGLVAETAKSESWLGPPPTIFEGHEPAHIEACHFIPAATVAERSNIPKPLQLWLGEAVSLKPSVGMPIKRQSGRNLLVLAKDEGQGVGVIMAALLSSAAQTERDGCQFKIVDLTSADASWADHPEEFAASMPHKIDVLGRRDLKTVLPEIEAEVQRRTSNDLIREPTLILTILGLHRARELRDAGSTGSSMLSMNMDDEAPNLTNCLAKILREGPEVGVHSFFWCDTYANLERAVDRGGLNEMGLRVSGPLTSQESHRLFDDEVASAIDKPHRMLKYDDDQVGAFELFRPYSIPPVDYIRDIGKQLTARP